MVVVVLYTRKENASAARILLDIETLIRTARLLIDITMEKKPSGAAFAPDTDSTDHQENESHTYFKETTVPVVRFWVLSVG